MKILLSAYSGLGNTIQLSALIRNIRAIEEKSVITVVSDNKLSQLTILDSRFINKLTVLKPKLNQLFKIIVIRKKIKILDLDYIFLPFVGSSLWLLLVSLSLKNVKIVTHIHEDDNLGTIKSLFKKFSKRIFLINFHENKNEIESYLDLLAALDINKEVSFSKRPYIKESNKIDFELRSFIGEKYICFQYGTHNGGKSPKMLNDDNCIDFLIQFERHFDHKIVLLGDALLDEKKIGNLKNIINLVGKTSLEQLQQCIRGASLVVCMDSAILHLSNALDVKTLAIYGPTNYKRTFPPGKRNFILKSKLHDSPCTIFNKYGDDLALKKCSKCKKLMNDLTGKKILNTITESNIL